MMATAQIARARPADATNAVTASAAFLVLALLLPLTLVRWDQANLGEASIWIAYAIVMYVSVRLAWIAGSGRPEWLHAGFWIFTYIFMGLAFLAQLVTGRYPDDFSYSQNTLTRSGIVILVGIIAYDVGRHMAGSHYTFEVLPSRWDVNIKRTILVGVIGLFFVGVAISRFGVLLFFSSRDAVDQALQGTTGVVTAQFIKTESKAAGQLFQTAVTVPVFMALYMLLIARKTKLHKSLQPTNQAALLLFLGALMMTNLVVNNPLGSSRFWAGLVLLGVASVAVNHKRRTVFRLALIGFTFVFLFAFGALDAFRRTGARDFSRGGAVSEVLLTQYDYGASQIANETVVYVERNGHTLGKQLMGVAGFWIPRGVWSDKPIPTGPLVSRGFVHVASPLWSEGYIDFGLLGTALLLAFYGWGSRRIDSAYLASSSSAWAILIPLLVGYQFILLRGALIPAFSGLVFLLAIARMCLHKSAPIISPADPPPSSKDGSIPSQPR